MESKPNYYAVLPAEVLFNSNISNNAKVLFGVISSLTSMNNKCFASDSYFAKNLDSTKPTIQRWLKELEDNKLIKRSVVYKEGSKEIEKRYIQIRTTLLSNTDCPTIKNEIDNTNLTDSNTNLTDSNNIDNKYAFYGDIVKITHKQFKGWKKLYSKLDLDRELTKLDIEFSQDKPKNWFSTASHKLNYQNNNAKGNAPTAINRVLF